MASTETPTRAEIYYGVVYRKQRARGTGETDARSIAEHAVKMAVKYGYPTGY